MGVSPKFFSVQFKAKTTYDRALGLADYSNYAFDAFWHVGSSILRRVDTEKGVQRWQYIKYIAFKGKVNEKKSGRDKKIFFSPISAKNRSEHQKSW